MANNYEVNEIVTLEDYEELRRTLKTPDNHMIDSMLYNNNDFNFDNSINYSEILSSMSFISTTDNIVQLFKDSDDIPFDHTEWQIMDPYSGKKRRPRQNEFLQLLLENSRYSSYTCWLDKNQGLFQILLPDQVAALWGKVKKRQTMGEMNYAIFSRGIRCYYKKGLMIKTHKRYTFCFNQSKNNISS
jgi:hypothetical protein